MPRPPKFGEEEQERLFDQGLKRCTGCNIIKPLSEFYKRTDGHTKYGYASQCKQCTIDRTISYHKTEQGREISRAAINRYFKTEKGKYARKKWEQNNKLKMQAHHAVSHAIENGEIEKPNTCSECGAACNPQSHHWRGYAKKHWLDILWLCQECHTKKHH